MQCDIKIMLYMVIYLNSDFDASTYMHVEINSAIAKVTALGNAEAPMLTTPFFGAAVTTGASVISGCLATTVIVLPVVVSTFVLTLSVNAVLVIFVFNALAAVSSFAFTSYSMTNFFANKRLRLTSTSLIEMIVTSLAATPKKIVKQKLEFTGLTATQANGKKKELEGDIAKSLGVAASDVTIISIKEVDVRRRRLLAKKLVIEYEVKAKDDTAANALKTKMTSTAFTDSVKTKVETTTGKTITVVAKQPEITDAPVVTAAPKKGVVSMGASALPSAVTFAMALLISTCM
jgi:hypothetical protein